MKRYIHILLIAGLFFNGIFLFAAEPEKPPAPQPETPTAPAPEKPAPSTAAAWNKTIQLKEENTLVVNSNPAHVRIIPWDKKELTVTAEGIDKKDYPLIQLTTKNKDVKLDYKGDKQAVGTLQVQLPATLNLDVTSAGNVEIKGPVNSKVKIRNSLGTITTADITGNVTVESTNADIVMANVQGNCILSTNGDIEIQDVSGDLEIKNTSGDTYVKNVGGAVNGKTADGDFSVGDVGGNATVLSTIGDIELRKVSGLANLNSDGGDIDLFEASGLVIAASQSGDITLRQVSGSVDVKTNDGDIMAELYTGNGGASKLFSQEGELAVYFPPEAKATVEAKVKGTGQAAADEDEGQIQSDFKSTKTEKTGPDLTSHYLINGGGDTVSVETVGGDILIKKLTPKIKPAAANTNP